MGNAVSNIVEKIGQRVHWNEPPRIICSGLDSAGKTTLMYMLNPQVESLLPTIGFYVEEILYNGLNILSWDVGGRTNMRVLYRHYYQSAAGLVYIVDIASRDSWETTRSKEELERLLTEPTLIGLPLLILGNKADLPTAMSLQEVEDFVDLKTIQQTRVASVRMISALGYKADEEPIKKSFGWLKQQIKT